VGDAQHLRIDARQQPDEDVRREPLEVAHARALDRAGDPLAQLVGGGVGRAAQAELDVGPRSRRQLASGDEAVAIGGTGELVGRGARDQRAVEVEEGGAARGRAVAVAARRQAATSTITASP
jgi:hypothetical protein